MKKVISLILAICVALPLFAAGCNKETTPPEEKAPESLYFSEISPAYGDTVPLIDGPIYYYWRNYDEPGFSDIFGAKRAKDEEWFLPKPLTISWKYNEEGALYYYVDIGMKEDLSDSVRYTTPRQSCDINNLFTASTYYYKITAVTNEAAVESPVYKVKTENTVRTINISKVSNTRDLGGWLTEDGKQRIKQGIIYRGACLDTVSRKTKYEVTGIYGIKTEIDCREGAVVSPFSKDEGFNYITVKAPYYVGTSSGINATNKEYQKSLATEIRTFADAKNFPIYFHCQIGRDRTGTLALFIEAICGVSKKDIYKDYELYHFASVSGGDPMIGTMKPNIDNLVRFLEDYYSEDGNLQEGVVNFCKQQLGITDEEIENIRKNCLEPVPEEDYSPKIPLEEVTKEFSVDERTFLFEDLKATEIIVKEGSYPDFEIFTNPEDNEGGKIKYAWSEDAFNEKGGFAKGTHSLTVKVQDKNKTIVEEKLIVFHAI